MSTQALQSSPPVNIAWIFIDTIFRYREYLKQSVARDLRKRYKRSVLGYVWSMLQPLLMMIILAVVFSNIMRSNVKDYSVFLFTAMLPWKYFSSTANDSLNSISGNINLINQVPVPKFLFPLAYAFSNLADFFLTLVPLFLVMLFIGRDFPVTILALPLVLLPLFFMSMGVALIFAVSNVFFRDTQHLVGVVLQALYFLCPVIYSIEHLPAWLVPYLKLNPLFGIIEMMRGLFYYGELPSLLSYLSFTGGSLAILIFSLWLFKKADNKFIYFI